jgi:hypothetical protein
VAGIFDFIPVFAVVLFALGLVGVMIYEKTRSNSTEEYNL